VAIPYRRFKNSRSKACPKTPAKITTTFCIITQKSAVLIYFEVEAEITHRSRGFDEAGLKGVFRPNTEE
jgi:hypothetical protein